MKRTRCEIAIAAPLELIWAVLTDTSRWPAFDPFTLSAEGQPAPGAHLAIRSRLAPGRVFKVRVQQFEPPHRMVFSSGMPFGLFRGDRTYLLTSQGDNKTMFSMEEVFSGPMLRMIGKHLPDMTEAFDSFCTGLKREVEARSNEEAGK